MSSQDEGNKEIIEALEIAISDKERQLKFLENRKATILDELKKAKEGLIRARKLSS